MKKNKSGKSFDAVALMREIRNKISAETQGMNLEQLQKYMQEQTKSQTQKPKKVA